MTAPRPDARVWEVPVTDAASRPRTFRVAVNDAGDVVLRAPPGESCILPTSAADQKLMGAVYEARELGLGIKRRRGGS